MTARFTLSVTGTGRRANWRCLIASGIAQDVKIAPTILRIGRSTTAIIGDGVSAALEVTALRLALSSLASRRRITYRGTGVEGWAVINRVTAVAARTITTEPTATIVGQALTVICAW